MIFHYITAQRTLRGNGDDRYIDTRTPGFSFN